MDLACSSVFLKSPTRVGRVAWEGGVVYDSSTPEGGVVYTSSYSVPVDINTDRVMMTFLS